MLVSEVTTHPSFTHYFRAPSEKTQSRGVSGFSKFYDVQRCQKV